MILVESLRELSEKEIIIRKYITFEILEVDIDPIKVMQVDETSEGIDENCSSLFRRKNLSQMIRIPEISSFIIVIDEGDELYILSLFRDGSEGLLEFLRIDQSNPCIRY